MERQCFTPAEKAKYGRDKPKKLFRAKEHADNYLRYILETRDPEIHSFFCCYCQGFHIGHPPRFKEAE